MTPSNPMFCPHCGSPVETGDAFCVNCGAALNADSPAFPVTPAEKRETVPPSKKPQNKATRLLVAAVIIALAFFGGKLLAG